MEQVDIRKFLYHGISAINSDLGELHILDSILKTGHIVDATESKKYGVKSIYDTYLEMGYSSRISLGFYPLDQKTYELSKRKHPDFYGEKIADKIKREHRISEENLDSYVMSTENLNLTNTHQFDFAWKRFYKGITLILNKKLLDDLSIADFGLLADEICIEEPIDVRKYLEYIAIRKCYYLKEILQLLQKYDYDSGLIDFDTGEIIKESNLELKLVNKITDK